VCCNACGASTEYYLTEAEAIAAWNQRPDTGQDAELRELAQGLLSARRAATTVFDYDKANGALGDFMADHWPAILAALRAPAADEAVVGRLSEILECALDEYEGCEGVIGNPASAHWSKQARAAIAAMKEGKP
jgi:hypothetical protein